MTAVESVVVVGGGITGLAVASLLAKGGIRVDIVEARRTSDAVGSGISLQGNALRMLDVVGVWDEVRTHAAVFDGLVLRAPDDDGTVLFSVDAHRAGGPEFPAAGGMYRPDLARILRDRADDLGVVVHEDSRVVDVRQGPAGATVVLASGAEFTADLVIGADGLHSTVRRIVGFDAEPEMLDFGVWRAFVPRVAGVESTELIYGGASYYSGYSPTGPSTMYAYIVDDFTDRSDLTPAQLLAQMREAAAKYHGPWDAITGHLTEESRVNYTRMSFLQLEGPWHRGNVVLIGDAAHSCPPTLAQGAGQGLEDAVVLAELLCDRDSIERLALGRVLCPPRPAGRSGRA